MFCKYCGKHIEDGSHQCPNCGAVLNASMAPSQGHKMKAVLKQKPVAIGLVAVLILAVLGVVALSMNSFNDPGYYQGIAWGTSYEDFHALYKDEELIVWDDKNKESVMWLDAVIPGYDKKNSEMGENDIIGEKGVSTASFEFDRSGLYGVSLLLIPNEENVEELNSTIRKCFVKEYGEPVESKGGSDGEILRYGKWETEASVISLRVTDWPLDGIFLVEYTENDHYNSSN